MKNIVIVIALALSLIGGIAPAAHAYRFGSQPLDDAVAAADREKTCVSKGGLASLMIAASIAETVGGSSTVTPSPMTMGRADTTSVRSTNRHLYEGSSTSTPYPRAFWHAGLGLYQLDYMGDANSTAPKISTWTSSLITAREMNRLYCNTSGTHAQRRAAAWSPWYACGGGRCESIFWSIYHPSTPKLTRDTTVGRYGGMVQRSCFHAGDPNNRFTCWFVNPSNAQGHRGTWQQAPLAGNSNRHTPPSPLTAPYYTYLHSGNNLDYRHWISTHSGYSTSVYANRALGRNIRNGVAWYRRTVLCDATTWTGACGGGSPQ